KAATQTIPIVMVATPDPVAMGVVASLARPGGNITGLTTLSADMSVKQLELLKQLLPRATTLAILSNPTNPWHPHALRLIETNAKALDVEVLILSARTPDQGAEAISNIASRRSAGGVVILADPMTVVHCAKLSGLALTHRLPAVVPVAECAVSGGLAS